MPLQLDHARKTAIDRSVVVRRYYDAMLPVAVHLPPRSRFRLALDLIVGVPVLGALWCTACGFWDTGLNPTQRWQEFEVASAEIGLA